MDSALGVETGPATADEEDSAGVEDSARVEDSAGVENSGAGERLLAEVGV